MKWFMKWLKKWLLIFIVLIPPLRRLLFFEGAGDEPSVDETSAGEPHDRS